MYLKIKLIFLLLTISLLCLGQQTEKISYYKVFGGYTYAQGNQILSTSALSSILDEYPRSAKLMNDGKTQADIATLMSFGGAFAVGWPVGTFIGGGDPNWYIAALGAGVLLVAIPLQIGANNKIIKAIDLYNQEEQKTSLRLLISPFRTGLAIKF